MQGFQNGQQESVKTRPSVQSREHTAIESEGEKGKQK